MPGTEELPNKNKKIPHETYVTHSQISQVAYVLNDKFTEEITKLKNENEILRRNLKHAQSLHRRGS